MTGRQRLCPWNQRQVANFAKQVREDYGGGWALLVPKLRHAAADAKVLSVVLGNHQDVTRDQIAAFTVELATALNLEPE